MMKVIMGADHAGFRLKELVKKHLKKKGYDIEDVGAEKLVKTDDYPDYAAKAARKVSKSRNSRGILFCGSAEGMCIAANKIRGIRATPVWTLKQARLVRLHNDANILCLAGGGTMEPTPALPVSKANAIADAFLSTRFSGEERHKRRIEKIKNLEKKR
ncbi:MAG: RpiB/LacA/LacB family sugar-phosphate isomerase [Candidatus Woesearchaeota archaeon]